MKVIDIKLFQVRRRVSPFGAAVQYDFAMARLLGWLTRFWNSISPW
jgi:hypothetical protein